ncbi:MAG: DNA repair protein [Clostridia bacterium]|nr:DNA repair protein [Clostridia bacterium]
MQKVYMCIDLKSFYASVECVDRGLDPMITNLVVADPERTDKTICLAITPSMKSLGIKNRCRLFEIPKNIEYIIAPPRMKRYIDCSAEIYGIYLKYIAKEDIHVYSIDEVFMDVTAYLGYYSVTPEELGQKIMQDILSQTGIRAACGIGTNLYLAKIALDITAKHSPDFIGYLDEEIFCQTLSRHRPLTDFWRIGRGTAKHLERLGIYDMQGISSAHEDLLYRHFGVDAELLIDHSRGRETVTMHDIKTYVSKAHCITSGQVLMRDYDFEEGRLIVKEMTDLLCLDLVEQNLVTKSITLHVGYSNSLSKAPAHGSISVISETNSYKILIPAVTELYDRIVEREYPVRRINISMNDVSDEVFLQGSLFDDFEMLGKSRSIQKAVIGIKKRFGKNAVLKGMNFEKAATTAERNRQIGGHKSGEG